MALDRRGALAGFFFAALAAGAPTLNAYTAEPPRNTPPAKAALQLQSPVNCEAVGGCVIQNYVDLEPGPEARDYRCGSLTYDGHNGVDFAVRDLAAMRHGVPVRAPASGTVLRIRDGVPDNASDRRIPKSAAGRKCGNGLVIYHQDGWETQLCHLRRGSVRVREGERVTVGQPVGLIGLSGNTELPHVHLTLRRHGVIFDPFTGLDRSGSCGQESRSLWSRGFLDAYPYRTTEIIRQGFATKRPTPNQIIDGKFVATAFSSNANALFFWAAIKGLKSGDVVALRIVNAAGKTVARRRYKPLDRNKARVFVHVGGKARRGHLRPGSYRGELEIIRDGADGGSVAFQSNAGMVVR